MCLGLSNFHLDGQFSNLGIFSCVSLYQLLAVTMTKLLVVLNRVCGNSSFGVLTDQVFLAQRTGYGTLNPPWHPPILGPSRFAAPYQLFGSNVGFDDY